MRPSRVVVIGVVVGVVVVAIVCGARSQAGGWLARDVGGGGGGLARPPPPSLMSAPAAVGPIGCGRAQHPTAAS